MDVVDKPHQWVIPLSSHPTRVRYENPKIWRWKNWEPNTPFAPKFDIPIYMDHCGDDLSSKLVDIICKESICRERDSDNWMTYNIFDWDFLELKVLCDKIYHMYEDYVSELGLPCLTKDKIWIRGWGLALDDGKGVMHHSHSFHENSFLSGNLSLSTLTPPTTTDYYFPYLSWYFGYWMVENTLGKIMLFPSWLEHRVKENTTGQVRVSLAFDMFTEHSIDYVSNNRNQSSALQKTLLLSKRMIDV